MATLKVDTITSEDQASVSITDGLVISGVTTMTNTLNVDAGSNGMIDFGDLSGGYGRLYADSTGTFIGSKSSDPLILRTDHTERIRITSSGDVGIGNNSPNCKLAIKDTAEHTPYANVTPSVGDCMFQLYNNPANETALDHATMQFGVNGGSQNRVNTISAVVESASNRKMATTFCTDSGSNRNERVRISGDGNVGVGTVTPGSLLHLSADSATAQLRIQRTNEAANTNDYGRIYWASYGGTLTGQLSVARESAENDGYMVFKTAASGTLGERLRITKDGAWGIAGANYGSSGQVLTSGGSGAAVSWASVSGGPTHYSKFTLESVQGNNDPINNWDLYSPGISPTINTAVTNTGGVFSFPSTGIWECQASILFYLNGGTTEFRLETYGTTDDGSSWDIIGRQYGWFHNNSSTNYMSVSTMPFLLDITNTSNCKVKFVIAGGPASLYTGGDDNDLYSGCHFIRWADT